MKIEKVYWNISEVAEMINVNTSTLRFWESKFYWLKPKRSKRGERKFNKKDVELVENTNLLINILGMNLHGVLKAYANGYHKDLERIIKKHEKRESEFEFARETEHNYE